MAKKRKAVSKKKSATKKKSANKKAAKTTRGRKQDRKRVAKGQKYEVRYEAKKTSQEPGIVEKAIEVVGNVRQRIEDELTGKK